MPRQKIPMTPEREILIKERQREAYRKYQAQHRDRCKEAQKRYAAKHREEISRKHREYITKRKLEGTLVATDEQKRLRTEYDAAKKRVGRQKNSDYAQRTREAKRTTRYRAKANTLRATESYREKQRQHMQEYRKRPDVKAKMQARNAVLAEIVAGRLTRPDTCSRCGATPPRGRDGRSLIRADHYMGYAREHWLTIQWICCKCDGELERERAAKKASLVEPEALLQPDSQ